MLRTLLVAVNPESLPPVCAVADGCHGEDVGSEMFVSAQHRTDPVVSTGNRPHRVERLFVGIVRKHVGSRIPGADSMSVVFQNARALVEGPRHVGVLTPSATYPAVIPSVRNRTKGRCPSRVQEVSPSFAALQDRVSLGPSGG
jgi:hypothetical protein